jgi:hypothetical protein
MGSDPTVDGQRAVISTRSDWALTFGCGCRLSSAITA